MAIAVGVLVLLVIFPAATGGLFGGSPLGSHTVEPTSGTTADVGRGVSSAGVRSTSLPRGSGLTPSGDSVSEWVNVTEGISGGPPARSNASAVWDPVDGYFLLFGGQSGTTPLNDTWTFANGIWTQLHPRASPSPRFGAGIAFDAADGYVVLYGGANAAGPGGVIPLNPTWTFVGGSWSNLGTTTTPQGRGFPSMAYDSNISAVILFGGMLASTHSALTWEFVDAEWTPLNSGGSNQPSPRVAASMTFDAASKQLVLFGGLNLTTPTPTALNDTWIYSWNATHPVNSTWVREPTPSAPAPRFDASAAYDNTTQSVVLFGGESSNGPLNDTWLWNGSRWALFTSDAEASAPSDREGAAFGVTVTAGNATAGPANVLTLVGGAQSSGAPASDVWVFGNLSLSVLPPIVMPGSTDVGRSATLTVLAFGGDSATYTFSWQGLPPGCLSSDVETMACTPTSTFAVPFEVSVVVTDLSGNRVQSPATQWVVNEAPKVTEFTALPSPITRGSTLSLVVVHSGGTSPLRFAYLDLPGGCSTTDSAQFNCTPNTPGSYTVEVLITDAEGEASSANTTVVVTNAVTPSQTWDYVAEGILFAAVVLVLLVAIFWTRRRQKRGAGNPPETGATPAATPSNGAPGAPTAKTPPAAPPG